MYHYTDGGLQNVWLANGYTLRTTPFGEAITIHDTDGLTRAICLALTNKAGILTGTEFRYIRQGGMALSQPALGKMLGIDGQSVARWEKTGKVPKWADKLLRLLYVAQANGHEPICQAIERLRVVERWVKQRIVVQGSAHGWQPTLQPLESDELALVASNDRVSIHDEHKKCWPMLLGCVALAHMTNPSLTAFFPSV